MLSEAVSKENEGISASYQRRQTGKTLTFKSYEKSVDIDGILYRAIIIHSNFYDKRKKKKIQKELEKDLEVAKEIKKKLESIEYFCCKDAEVAKKKAAIPKHHSLNIKIAHRELFKRGRPRNLTKRACRNPLQAGCFY